MQKIYHEIPKYCTLCGAELAFSSTRNFTSYGSFDPETGKRPKETVDYYECPNQMKDEDYPHVTFLKEIASLFGLMSADYNNKVKKYREKIEEGYHMGAMVTKIDGKITEINGWAERDGESLKGTY